MVRATGIRRASMLFLHGKLERLKCWVCLVTRRLLVVWRGHHEGTSEDDHGDMPGGVVVGLILRVHTARRGVSGMQLGHDDLCYTPTKVTQTEEVSFAVPIILPENMNDVQNRVTTKMASIEPM